MQILFTSASTPTALALAKTLAAEGHIIHAADEERVWGTAPARYSRAYRCFHRLSGSWGVAELWKAIGDHVDLIIPFGPLPGHVVESLKSRGANIIGETLAHNDYEFQDFVRETIIEASSETPSIIKVPASYVVHSPTCIAEILSNRESTFALQPLPCYETDDEDTLVDVGPASPSVVEPHSPLVLSCSTLDDRAVEAIKRLAISDTKPYRLIEVAQGGSFYSAHAFVHAGSIRTFVLTNARAADKDFVIVPAGQPLYHVLYHFTRRLAEVLDSWQTVVANHVSLTFHVQDKIKYGDFIRRVTVVSCHNLPHPSLILLASMPSLRKQLAIAYTAPCLAEKKYVPVQFSADARAPKATYSASLAVSALARILLDFKPWRWDWWASLAHMTMMCWVWAVNFKEEMWDPKDPGPALCLWVVLLLKRVGRVRGVSWAARRLMSIDLKLLLIVRVIKAMVSVMLSIWRFWFAMLFGPWYWKAQHCGPLLASEADNRLGHGITT